MNAAFLLSQTYNDLCDIYRYESTVVQGVTRYTDILKGEGIKCAISQGTLGAAVTKSVTEISSNFKVFMLPNTDIKEGDKLVIRQKGSNISKEYKVGEIFIYDGSHLEAKVSRSDKV